MRSRRLVAAIAALSVLATGCSRIDRGGEAESAPDLGPAAELRLGYFPNVTHAPALVGLEKGLFEKELGDTTLTRQEFNAGPNAVAALLGGSLDIGFIGSGPAINAYAKSDGDAVRLVSGVTTGGAQLVVRPGIDKPSDLAGKTVVTPQLGNTQDVALKTWLSDEGLTDRVDVTNMENAQTLDAFRGGDVQAAWLPEPWSSRLVLDAGGTVLLDEEELWPGGRFPTTVVVVRTRYLHEHPATVRAFLRGLIASIDYANENTEDAQTAVNTQLEALTGKALAPEVIERAWANITLTVDPIAGEFTRLAQDQVTAGITTRAPEVAGFADLTQLNTVLEEAGQPAVDAGGLDKD